MFSYPVQRQRLPEMASRISRSVGLGFLSRNSVPVMIMPGVQNPHCSPCSWRNPSCTGVSSVPLQIPSMVVTSCPSVRTASTVHGTRSAVGRVTPPVGSRQPEMIPDKVNQEQPRLDICLPQLAVDIYLHPHRIPFLSRPLDSRLQGPTDQNLHQVLLKGHRTAGVLDRVALLGRLFPGPLVQLRVRTLSSEQLLGFASPERRASDATHPDSYVFYLSAVHVQRHAYRRRGVVAGPALDLDVGARVGHPGDTVLSDYLTRFEDRLVEASVKFVYSDSPLLVGATHHDLAAYSRERRRQVLPWVSVSQRATHRAHVSDQRVSDQGLRLAQQRVTLLYEFRLEDVPVPGQRPYLQHPVLVPDVAELVVQIVDVYEHLRHGKPEPHHRDQAVPPGQELRLRSVPLQEAYGLVHGARYLVLKPRRYLQHRLLSHGAYTRLFLPVPTTQDPENKRQYYNKRHIFPQLTSSVRKGRDSAYRERLRAAVFLSSGEEAVSCSGAWIGPDRSESRPPECPVREAIISPAIATAVSSGVRAPMSSPIGLAMRESFSAVTPSSFKRAVRLWWVRLLPIAPMYPAGVSRAAFKTGTSNLGSWVRTQMTVRLSTSAVFKNSSGQATTISSAEGNRSRVANTALASQTVTR